MKTIMSGAVVVSALLSFALKSDTNEPVPNAPAATPVAQSIPEQPAKKKSAFQVAAETIQRKRNRPCLRKYFVKTVVLKKIERSVASLAD